MCMERKIVTGAYQQTRKYICSCGRSQKWKKKYGEMFKDNVFSKKIKIVNETSDNQRKMFAWIGNKENEVKHQDTYMWSHQEKNSMLHLIWIFSPTFYIGKKKKKKNCIGNESFDRFRSNAIFFLFFSMPVARKIKKK